MAARPRKKVAGARRAASWVHEVINPLLDMLPNEISLVTLGNLTWRFHRGTFDALLPIYGYLSPQGRHILRDFRKADPSVREPFDKHDTLLSNLCTRSSQAFQSLAASETFRQKVSACLASIGVHPGGAPIPPDFVELMAEHVLNNTPELPERHLDHVFWQAYGASLREFRRGPEFDMLCVASEDVLRHDEFLVTWLEERSFNLCSEYDIPAAPCSAFASSD